MIQPAELNAESIRSAVKRLQATPGLGGAPTLQRLLDFTVEAVLAGRADEVKETTLALEVFGRNSSFDPRKDPIVRVQARKLRDRLAAWYEQDGAQDEVIIEYNRGSYVPRFLPRSSTTRSRHRSVAVLPFRNLSDSAEVEYLCDGIAEEIRYLLSRVHAVQVVARTSAMQVANGTDDTHTIGSQLNTDLLIRGTVRVTGPDLRVTAELVAVEDGYLLWAERWHGPFHDVFRMQDEIAAAVAGALQSHSAPVTSTRRSTSDIEAYRLYLKGRFFWNQRTQHGFTRAIEHFEAALAVDPAFARAYASLADTYALTAAHHLAAPAQCLHKARHCATRAVQLDPNLAAARSALATTLLFFDRNPAAAQREWRQALQLDPQYAYAWHGFSVFGCFVTPRAADAPAAIYEARRLEPLSAAIACDVGFTLYATERFQEAITACHEAIDLHPSFSRTYVCLARCHAALGQYDAAIETCVKGRPLFTGRAFLGQLLATHAWSCARAGRTAEAHAILRQLEADCRDHFVAKFDLAVIHAGLGHSAMALKLLEQAAEDREVWAISIPVEPLLHCLHTEPRFRDLATRIFEGKALSR
jgi:serine/threonine-protein kinase